MECHTHTPYVQIILDILLDHTQMGVCILEPQLGWIYSFRHIKVQDNVNFVPFFTSTQLASLQWALPFTLVLSVLTLHASNHTLYYRD